MEVYKNPLTSRYSSPEMSKVFSPSFTHSTWRRLWVALAQVQKDLGLSKDKKVLISESQLAELSKHVDLDSSDYERAKEYEKQFRHDVMAHIHAFGVRCPNAKSIIHLGATSCYVKDNTWIIQMVEGLKLIKSKILNVLKELSDFCLEHAELPTLGFTHFQPAQLVTVGKRACLWLQDLVYDFNEVEQRLDIVMKSFRGVKGTTGTQASYLDLFNGDKLKVKKLDEGVTKMMGMKGTVKVAGQTYTRKLDFLVLATLSGICQTCHKLAVDLRLLQHLGEVSEPFSKKQIGSSAMAYKKNPMRSERICSLARFVISLASNPAHTHANQWLERTLDDSANRRLSIPQAFLATDGVLRVVSNVVSGLVVFPRVVMNNINKNLPFMVTENVLMAACKMGGNRQNLHEIIRVLSMETIKEIKEEGKKNTLMEKMKQREEFKGIDFETIMDTKKLIGRAGDQVKEYVSIVKSILEENKFEKKKEVMVV